MAKLRIFINPLKLIQISIACPSSELKCLLSFKKIIQVCLVVTLSTRPKKSYCHLLTIFIKQVKTKKNPKVLKKIPKFQKTLTECSKLSHKIVS